MRYFAIAVVFVSAMVAPAICADNSGVPAIVVAEAPSVPPQEEAQVPAPQNIAAEEQPQQIVQDEKPVETAPLVASQEASGEDKPSQGEKEQEETVEALVNQEASKEEGTKTEESAQTDNTAIPSRRPSWWTRWFGSGDASTTTTTTTVSTQPEEPKEPEEVDKPEEDATAEQNVQEEEGEQAAAAPSTDTPQEETITASESTVPQAPLSQGSSRWRWGRKRPASDNSRPAGSAGDK